ncbi:MAG: purine nucleoside permease [Pseudomonadota bacterium]
MMFDDCLRRVAQTSACLVIAICAACAPETPSTDQVASLERIDVKVVVVAMFEYGEPTGDRAGELQHWVEDMPLDKSLPFAMGEQQLFYNDDGVLAVLLGGGIANATASTMALGLDPRLDLSKAYWLVAGIAGGDPEDLSLGSAAWATHVVDGDLLYEIDGREIPDDWPYGLIPLGAKKPAVDPKDIYTGWTVDTIAFSLNAELVDWAFELTRDMDLGDSDGIRDYRNQYDGFPNAQKPPFVTRGDTLAASTYWHGEMLNKWANDWVSLYRGGDANFMTSNMEDTGTLTALHRLARAGHIDADRVLVLRTASNFTMPPPGKTAAWSTTAPYADNGEPALRAAYVVGRKVVDEIVNGWAQYASTLPSADEQ